MKSEFLLAVESEDLDAFKSLVEGGSSILSDLTPHGNTILHIALMYGNAELALEICSYDDGYQLMWKANKKGETPLHYAAASLDNGVFLWTEDVLSRLKSLEILKAKDVEGNTALSIAAAGGHAKLVRLMLEINGDLSMDVNNDGESALYRAALGGWRDAVSILLGFAFPTGNGGPRCRSILHAAVCNSDLQMALDIVEKMPEPIDGADVFGCTPMHYAVSSGHRELVGALLQRGSSAVYTLNNNGRSPLHEAVELGYYEIVHAILDHCRDSMEVLDSKGRNVLHIAAESGKDELIYFILNKTKNWQLINQRDADGNTPLHLASIHYKLKAIAALLKDDRTDLFIENHAGQPFSDVAVVQPTIENFRLQRIFVRILRAVLPRESPIANTLITKKRETLDAGARLQYKSGAQKTAVVATLVATVTFAAGLTAPGGFVNDGPEQGALALARTRALNFFIIFDVGAFVLSLLMVSTAYTPPENFAAFLRFRELSDAYLMMSLSFMTLAFSTGLYAVLAPRNHSTAVGVFICCWMLPVYFPASYLLPYFWNDGLNLFSLASISRTRRLRRRSVGIRNPPEQRLDLSANGQ